MRIVFTLFFICFTSILLAQGPGRGSGPRQGGETKMPEFKSEQVVGIFNYDIKSVLKKLKIKNNDQLKDSVKIALDIYNSSITTIGIKNKELFEGLDVIINANMKTAIANRDREGIRNAREMTKEKLTPAILEVRQREVELNETLKNLLSESQYENWVKYQKSKKDKMKPKIPNRGGNNERPRPGGGRGR